MRQRWAWRRPHACLCKLLARAALQRPCLQRTSVARQNCGPASSEGAGRVIGAGPISEGEERAQPRYQRAHRALPRRPLSLQGAAVAPLVTDPITSLARPGENGWGWGVLL